MPLRALHGLAPWPSAMIVAGPGFRSAPHHHHCVQLILALHGTLLVPAGRKKAWMRCGAVWIQTDARHEVDARGTTLMIGFIDAESDLGSTLCERIEGAIARVPARQVARWRAVLGLAPDAERAERWLSTFPLRRQRSLTIHPGVGTPARI